MKRTVYVILAFVLSACLGQAANGEESSEAIAPKTEAVAQASSPQVVEEQFPFPEIPATLRTPESRKEYLLRNYWTCFDFGNRALLENRNVTEQGLVNFIALMADGRTGESLMGASMQALCESMMSYAVARDILGKLLKDYLYNPNSPMYNETLYAHYLQALMACENAPMAERQRAGYLIRLIRRNRPGEAATNFTYYNKEGKRMTLAELPVRSDSLILLFYDPECDECHELLARMSTDSRLDEAVSTGKLSVLAIYTEEDEEVWRRTLPALPTDWLVGTDRGQIKEMGLYDLKAMPCLYLLDAQKKVLVKDGEYEEVMGRE